MNSQSQLSRLRQRFSLRHSIRRRIMVIFIGLMACMLLAVWAINNFWLERYYVSQKQEVMEQAGELDQRAPHDKIVDNSFAQEAMEALG